MPDYVWVCRVCATSNAVLHVIGRRIDARIGKAS